VQLGINHSFSNQFTAQQLINMAGAGTSPTGGLILQNTTAATALVPQQSAPIVVWQGNGWKNEFGSSISAGEFRCMGPASAGAVSPTGVWKLQAAVNNAPYSDIFNIVSDGSIANFGPVASTATVNIGNGTGAVASSGDLLLKFGAGQNFKASAGNIIGTGDLLWQSNPSQGGAYTLVEANGGLGIGLSSTSSAIPVIFAPNRHIAAQVTGNNNMVIGVADNNSALLQIGAGSSIKGSLVLTPPAVNGTKLGSLVNGAIEFDSTYFYITSCLHVIHWLPGDGPEPILQAVAVALSTSGIPI